MMELKSTINDTWKLSMVGSLIGCLIILLFLDQTNQNASFSVVRSMTTSLGLSPLLGGHLQPPSTTLNHTNSLSQPPLLVNLMPSNHTINVVEKPNITLDHFTNLPSQPALVNLIPSNDTMNNVVEKPNVTLDNHTNSLPSQPVLVNLMPSNNTIDVVEKPNITLDHTNSLPSQPALVDLMPSNNTINNVVEKPNITLDHTNNLPSQPALVDLMPNNDNINNVVEKPNITLDHVENPCSNSSKLNVTLGHHVEIVDMKSEKEECNIFEGKWVYKTEQLRLYDTNTCPFLEEKMSCQKNGRPDFEYEKWRWEPTHCDIPLFNGTYMLERLRNKRVIIVGDSLNRNMWESLACLLYTTIPSSRAHVQSASSTYKVFKAMDYNCVIEFYWSPFLIELNEHHPSGKNVLAVDKLSSSFKRWQGADVMVFNSGHWWTHMGKLRSWDMFQYEGKLVEEMPIEVAYERGMKTWAKWVENNVDPKKTAVFFRSISPEHYRENWCYNITQPIMDEAIEAYESRYPKSLIGIIKAVIKGMSKLQVKYLDITKLSSYRKDAHPSVYRRLDWKIYTTKYMTDIPSYADCSHWCLPGLPDTWNTLLYTSLFFNSSPHMSTS